MTRLSVNVDHVATLRQARGGSSPDPVEAAQIAEQAGAAGITIHLRSDRRHIQDDDLARIRNSVRGKLNLEMAATEEMVSIALRTRPDQVTLVPERPEEVTTEGGLDLSTSADAVAQATRLMLDAGISVSLFLDPDVRQIDRLVTLDCQQIEGFEINTDAYSKACSANQFSQSNIELDRIATSASHGAKLGLSIYAGHGLDTANVGAIAAISQIEELNIGHSIMARAVLVGLKTAVQEILYAVEAAGS